MRSCLLAFLVVLAPVLARADDAADAEAKAHYQTAEKAMAEGRYEAAAEEYGMAYEIKQDPLLFLKMGNALFLADKCATAVVYLKRYLKDEAPEKIPDSARAAAEEKIAKCEGTSVATTTEPTEPTTEPDPDPESGTGTGTGTDDGDVVDPEADLTGDPNAPSFLDEGTSWKRSAGWISIGATVILGTAGAILAMSGNSREQDLASLTDFRDPNLRPVPYEGNVADRYETLVEEGERFNRLATYTLAAAGVTLAAGITFLVLDSRSSSSESGTAITLTPVLSPDHAGLATSLRF